MPKINPDILVWARETAGLTVEQACQKLGLSEAHGSSGAERLTALEEGAVEPSRAMLQKMAQQYRRPLIAFYLAEVPKKGDRGNDYRTLPDSVDASENALVDALVRDIKARQQLVKAVLQDDDEFEPLKFVGSCRQSMSVDEITKKLRDLLKFTETEQVAAKNTSDSFSTLRHQVEELGVFVLLAGDLGSHHSAISVEAFRGFALADNFAPFIVINDQDATTAWSFTLLHELTHILLGETGVSNNTSESRIEQICNDVASEFLLPRADLPRIGIRPGMSYKEVSERISEFSSHRNLSSSMIAYKLHRAGIIDRAMWNALAQSFKALWLSSRARRRELAKLREGGPNYYIVRRHRLGPALIQFVQRSLASGDLTPSTAGRVLGVRARNVSPLLSAGGA